MDETNDEAQRIFRELSSADELQLWEDATSLPDAHDVVEAGHAALGIGLPEAFREIEQERAQRRVVLFQIVAQYLDGTAQTWEDIFMRLTEEDRELVESLLGNDSLAELAGSSPKRWRPGNS